jgi:hypothetical protein
MHLPKVQIHGAAFHGRALHKEEVPQVREPHDKGVLINEGNSFCRQAFAKP